MGNSTSSRRSDGLEESMKYCIANRSKDDIPDNSLRKIKYMYPSVNCSENPEKVDNIGTLCADDDYLDNSYNQKIKDYFNQLDVCLSDNKFQIFMNYYNNLIEILGSNDNDYTVNEEGIIKLKNDIEKLNKYILDDKLGNINIEMSRNDTGDSQIGVLKDSVKNINSILDLNSSEFSDNYQYKFIDGQNDKKLNELNFFHQITLVF